MTAGSHPVDASVSAGAAYATPGDDASADALLAAAAAMYAVKRTPG